MTKQDVIDLLGKTEQNPRVDDSSAGFFLYFKLNKDKMFSVDYPISTAHLVLSHVNVEREYVCMLVPSYEFASFARVLASGLRDIESKKSSH